MNCKDRLESYLRDNQVSFETHHHPTAFTAQEVAASEHTPGKMVVKVVMVLADGELVMLAMPAPYQTDLDRVGEVLGATEVRLVGGGHGEHDQFPVGEYHDHLYHHLAGGVLTGGNLLGGESRGVVMGLEGDLIVAQVALQPVLAVHDGTSLSPSKLDYISTPDRWSELFFLMIAARRCRSSPWRACRGRRRRSRTVRRNQAARR